MSNRFDVVFTKTHCRGCPSGCVQFSNDGDDLCVTCQHPEHYHRSKTSSDSLRDAGAQAKPLPALQPGSPVSAPASAAETGRATHPGQGLERSSRGTFVGSSSPSAVLAPAAFGEIVRNVAGALGRTGVPSGAQPETIGFDTHLPRTLPHTELSAESRDPALGHNYRPNTLPVEPPKTRTPRGATGNGSEERKPKTNTIMGAVTFLKDHNSHQGVRVPSKGKDPLITLEVLWVPDVYQRDTPNDVDMKALRRAGFSRTIILNKKADQAETLGMIAFHNRHVRAYWKACCDHRGEKYPMSLPDSWPSIFTVRQIKNKKILPALCTTKEDNCSDMWLAPHTWVRLQSWLVKAQFAGTRAVVISPSVGNQFLATTREAVENFPSPHWGGCESGASHAGTDDLDRIDLILANMAEDGIGGSRGPSSDPKGKGKAEDGGLFLKESDDDDDEFPEQEKIGTVVHRRPRPFPPTESRNVRAKIEQVDDDMQDIKDERDDLRRARRKAERKAERKRERAASRAARPKPRPNVLSGGLPDSPARRAIYGSSWVPTSGLLPSTSGPSSATISGLSVGHPSPSTRPHETAPLRGPTSSPADRSVAPRSGTPGQAISPSRTPNRQPDRSPSRLQPGSRSTPSAPLINAVAGPSRSPFSSQAGPSSPSPRTPNQGRPDGSLGASAARGSVGGSSPHDGEVIVLSDSDVDSDSTYSGTSDSDSSDSSASRSSSSGSSSDDAEDANHADGEDSNNKENVPIDTATLSAIPDGPDGQSEARVDGDEETEDEMDDGDEVDAVPTAIEEVRPDLPAEVEEDPLPGLLRPPRVPEESRLPELDSRPAEKDWPLLASFDAEKAQSIPASLGRGKPRLEFFESQKVDKAERVSECIEWLENISITVATLGFPEEIGCSWPLRERTVEELDAGQPAPYTGGEGPCRVLFWQVCEELCSPEDGNTAFTPTLLDSPGHGLDPKPDPEHMKTHLHRLDVLGFVLILCIRCLDFLPDVITPAMYFLLVDKTHAISASELAYDPDFAMCVERLEHVFKSTIDPRRIDFSLVPRVMRYVGPIIQNFHSGGEFTSRNKTNDFFHRIGQEGVQQMIVGNLCDGARDVPPDRLHQAHYHLNRFGLISFVERVGPLRLLQAYGIQTTLSTREWFDKSRVEYIHEWQHDDAWRRIESYVSYAVALLTPQQSLRAFQEITGRKFVPRNAKIYFKVRRLFDSPPGVHACTQTMDVTDNMLFKDYESLHPSKMRGKNHFAQTLLFLMVPGYGAELEKAGQARARMRAMTRSAANVETPTIISDFFNCS